MKTTNFICNACGKKFRVPAQDYFRHGTSAPESYESLYVCPHCFSTAIEKENQYKFKKAELSQYYHLNKELEETALKLAAMDKNNEEHAELYELYENNKLRCLALLIKLEKYIYSIEDSFTRRIFELRYIKGYTWSKIALTLGGYHTPDALRIHHDRYLKKPQPKVKYPYELL